jgi:4-aminobutyrate aminotransferase-like enzyme
MQGEKLPERGQHLGDRLVSALESLRAQVPQIADVRGLGAMVAVQLDRPNGGGPDPDFAKKVQAQALDCGLILLTCGVDANVIRFLFPLTISEPVFDEALGILRDAFAAAVA